MKKFPLIILLPYLLALLLPACKKSEHKDLYIAQQTVASPVSDTGCLGSNPQSNAIKGTMLAGKTYTVCGDVYINENDTLIIQEGVTVNFTGKYGIGVKGTLLCLGTKDKPNYFTYPGLTRTDSYGADPNTDPALQGQWIGIMASPTCPLMVIKWTHIEFGGASIPSTSALSQINASPLPLLFQNPNGLFVFEDSWLYGSKTDALSIIGGKVSIMRNVFEKCGYTGGEGLTAKAGVIGDFAYNLCIGIATNGFKLSDAGAIAGVAASNMHAYNNTFINCGWRRSQAGRGGSVNFEQGAGGLAYNNLMINCKFGLRVVSNPIADTANLRYGYNSYYADSISVGDNIIPSQAISVSITNAIASDIPNPFTYLPSSWQAGDSYTFPSPLLSTNNPQFINGPCPLPAGLNLRDIAVAGSYDFHLTPASPCAGKGFTGFSARAEVPVDPIYGATEITPPGNDIGAFQLNGTGNHY